MMRSWPVWRRALSAAPVLSTTVAVLAVANTALFVLSSIMVSRTVEAVTDDAGADVMPLLIILVATLLAAAACTCGLRPAFVRLQRTIIMQQTDDALTVIERTEYSTVEGGDTRRMGALLERVVGVPHKEALGASTDLLSSRCRGWAGVVVLGVVSPISAVILAVSIIAYGRAFTSFLDDVLSGLASEGPLATRQARYVRALHFEPGIAGELRTFGALPWLVRKFTALSDTGRAQAFRQRQSHVRAVIGYAVLCAVALLGSIAWLVTQAWSLNLGVAGLMLGVQGALLMLDLGPAGDTAVMFRQAAATERELAEAAETSSDVAASSVQDGIDGSAITCHGLEYRYPGATAPALKVDELVIRHGERVAVVGRNGAGKSTLFGVISGALTPTAGTVAVDRETVSLALQRSVRYPVALRDNVSLGKAHVDTDGAMATIGESAQTLVNERADTMLGQSSMDGQNLSGGQWQRVGLARAFAHSKNGVLLLDEPSAALDPAAEAEFFQVALDQANDCTVLLSTHHLANTRFVDRIIVLDGGTIVAEGTHAQLMAEGGLYATLFATQAKSYGVNIDA